VLAESCGPLPDLGAAANVSRLGSVASCVPSGVYRSPRKVRLLRRAPPRLRPACAPWRRVLPGGAADFVAVAAAFGLDGRVEGIGSGVFATGAGFAAEAFEFVFENADLEDEFFVFGANVIGLVEFLDVGGWGEFQEGADAFFDALGVFGFASVDEFLHRVVEEREAALAFFHGVGDFGGEVGHGNGAISGGRDARGDGGGGGVRGRLIGVLSLGQECGGDDANDDKGRGEEVFSHGFRDFR
jgi:hypothetical protein